MNMEEFNNLKIGDEFTYDGTADCEEVIYIVTRVDKSTDYGHEYDTAITAKCMQDGHQVFYAAFSCFARGAMTLCNIPEVGDMMIGEGTYEL
jgi:hypothetical protein